MSLKTSFLFFQKNCSKKVRKFYKSGIGFGLHKNKNMMHGMAASQGEGAVEDVWAGNLEESFAIIRDIVVQFPYLGMVSF